MRSACHVGCHLCGLGVGAAGFTSVIRMGGNPPPGMHASRSQQRSIKTGRAGGDYVKWLLDGTERSGVEVTTAPNQGGWVGPAFGHTSIRGHFGSRILGVSTSSFSLPPTRRKSLRFSYVPSKRCTVPMCATIGGWGWGPPRWHTSVCQRVCPPPGYDIARFSSDPKNRRLFDGTEISVWR